MIAQTSLEIFHARRVNLGQYERVVYVCLSALNHNTGQGVTDNELIRVFGFPDHMKARARRNALVKKRLVECNGYKYCEVTGNKVKSWKVKK